MANYNYIDSSGTIVPDTSELLSTTQTYFKDVFGDDLNVDPETPQGVLITAQVIVFATVVLNNAMLGNQINPNLSGGVYLDAILALSGLARTADTHSVVSIVMNGAPSTIVPTSVQIANADGELFVPLANYTLNSSGTFTGDFEAVNPGAIATPANTVNIIVEGVPGLETVNNPDPGTLGTDTQSDPAARLKRNDTLMQQGSGSVGSILSALYATLNVKSATGRDNVESTSEEIDGVTLLPNSIYFCVDGGTDGDVAFTIIKKKAPGCNYTNGAAISVSYPYTDPVSGQTYTVKFDRPNLIHILVKATVQTNQSIVNPEIAVTKAIRDYANGLIDGEPGLRIGVPVSCFELSGAINIEVPGIFVVKVETSLASPIVYSVDEIPIAIFEKAVIDTITVVVV